MATVIPSELLLKGSCWSATVNTEEKCDDEDESDPDSQDDSDDDETHSVHNAQADIHNYLNLHSV